MTTRKSIYNVMRDWKRENCPAFSKMTTPQLQAQVNRLNLPIPEAPARRVRQPRAKRVNRDDDPPPQGRLNNNQIKNLTNNQVKALTKQAEAKFRARAEDANVRGGVLQGLQGAIVGRMPLDLTAPLAPDTPRTPRADMGVDVFASPVIKMPQGIQAQQAQEVAINHTKANMTGDDAEFFKSVLKSSPQITLDLTDTTEMKVVVI
mgnify:FL=1